MLAKVCEVCGYVFEENVHGKFEDLSDEWGCPHCGSEADMFETKEIDGDEK
jgi:rubredoxin